MNFEETKSFFGARVGAGAAPRVEILLIGRDGVFFVSAKGVSPFGEPWRVEEKSFAEYEAAKDYFELLSEQKLG